MNTQLALSKESGEISADIWQTMKEQAKMLITTNFLPPSIKTPEQAIAIMMQGRELGIPTMAALGTINIIQNKPTISPQLMLALINRSNQLENIEITQKDDSISCTMKRRGRTAHTEIFGKKEAADMQLGGKDNYKKQPMTMYRWRAVAACARTVFPDVVLGIYTPDEMGAENVNIETGELIPMAAQTSPIHAVPDIKPAAQPKPDADPLDKQIIERCANLNDAGDSILWKGATLTDYANELLDTDLDGWQKLDADKKNSLLGDLTGRLDEVVERAAIASQDEPETVEGEVVEEAAL